MPRDEGSTRSVVPPCFSSDNAVVRSSSLRPFTGAGRNPLLVVQGLGSEASSATPGLVCTVHQLSRIRAFRVLLLVVATFTLCQTAHRTQFNDPPTISTRVAAGPACRRPFSRPLVQGSRTSAPPDPATHNRQRSRITSPGARPPPSSAPGFPRRDR